MPERLAHGVGHREAAAAQLRRRPRGTRNRALRPASGRRWARCRRVGHRWQAIIPPLMATFDQLSAEQRAIIELVLKQGQELRAARRRCSACPPAACASWPARRWCASPPSRAAAVDDDWRGQLADYLLNQQTGPEATATKGHLRRSEAARGWARSVLDSLDQFYDPKNLPTIPEGEPAAAPAPRAQAQGRAQAQEAEKREKKEGAGLGEPPRRHGHLRPPPPAGRPGRWPWSLLFAVLVWPVGALTGGGDDDKPPAKKASKARRARSSASWCCARWATATPRPPAWPWWPSAAASAS